MPKSSKHKKERKADFTKAKLKLGKGKQVAANATNTSFSAKTIGLPSQLASATIKTVPTSRRNLTLPDLLVQCRHYSTPTKREALQEILQLLEAHPYLLHQHLLPLTTTVSHLIPDSSRSVRAAARDTLRAMAEGLSKSQLVSVSAGIVLFTLSALSSMEDVVRIDALKVLDLLLAYIPEELCRGWNGSAEVSSGAGEDLLMGQGKEGEDKGTGAKVVEALLGMLKIRSAGLQKAQGAFTTQAAGSDLSPTARLAVLTTLSTFLRASLSPSSVSPTATSTSSSQDSTPWYLSTSFLTPRSYASFLASFTSSASASTSSAPDVEITGANGSGRPTCAPIERFDLAFDAPLSTHNNDLFSLSSFGLFTPPTTPVASTSTSTTAPNAPGSYKPSLLTLLHPLLLSSFLDTAPTAFSPSAALALSLSSAASSSSRADAVETVEAVLGVARELFYRALGGASGAGVGEDGFVEGEKRERREARKNLLALLSHASPYFPFGGDIEASATGPARGQGKDEERYLALNLRFAELSSLLVLTTDEVDEKERREVKRDRKGKKNGEKGRGEREKKEQVERVVVERVQEWVVSALKGELTTPLHPLGLPLTPASYTALEPTLWSLLNQQDTVQAQEVWEAILGHFGKGGQGETRRRGWEFAARVILLQSDPSYSNRFDLALSLPRNGGEMKKDAPLSKWLVGAPKWLWEMGVKDVRGSELVLTFLLKLAQQGTKGAVPPSALTPLIPLLTPFFHLTHPSRGAFPGPFTKLPFSAQAKALDLVVYLSGLAEGAEEEAAVAKLREAVEKAVESADQETAEEDEEMELEEEEGAVRGRWEAVRGLRV